MMNDKKECVTGCVEKPTFSSDKKKTFWQKIKEGIKAWWNYNDNV